MPPPAAPLTPPGGRARGRRRVVLAAVAAGALAVMLAACTVPREPMVPGQHAAVLPEGVTIELVQLRSDVALRQAQLHIVNGTDESLTVGDVSVDDPRFSDPFTRVLDRTSTVPAGGAVDIRVQLTQVECPAPPEAASEASLELVGDDGPAIAVAPLPDPLGFLAPLHDRECRAAAVARAADVTLSGFTPSAPGAPAELHLTVAPTGRGAATIAGIRTTNLLAFGASAGETYPIGLEVAEGATGATVVTLPLVPGRCDPHAVQEDKRGTIFDVEVIVDGQPGEIQLAASEDMRGEILTWVAAWCGFGG